MSLSSSRQLQITHAHVQWTTLPCVAVTDAPTAMHVLRDVLTSAFHTKASVSSLVFAPRYTSPCVLWMAKHTQMHAWRDARALWSGMTADVDLDAPRRHQQQQQRQQQQQHHYYTLMEHGDLFDTTSMICSEM